MQNKPHKNAHGNGNIRQRSDGRWEGRYTAGFDPGTGKQIQKSVYGQSQKKVAEKLRHVQVDIDNDVYIEPSNMTLGGWLDIWIEEYQNHIKERTKIEYKGYVKNRIKPALGAVKLSQLNTPTIQRFYNNLGRDSGDRRPLNAKSVLNTHAMLHRALEQAVEIGFMKTNPTDACKLPRKERPDIKTMDDEHINKFLKAIKGNFYETLYIVDLFTGMRQGEVMGLSWECVDFDKGLIHIRNQLQLVGNEYKMISTKNSKPRTISPASFVMDLLREQRIKQNEMQVKAGGAWNNPMGLVFTNELGHHLHRNAVYRNFKLAASVIGMPNMRFHDLRHTYAVAAIRAGDDIKTIQDNLGHHTAAFTLDVYGHTTEQMKVESSRRMDRFIGDLEIG